MATSHLTPLPRHPSWYRRPNLVLAVCGALILLTSLVDLMTIPSGAHQFNGNPAGGYVALAVTLTGIGLAWWHPWPGFLIMVTGPLVATALDWDPIVPWNLVIFATLALTLRGLPGLPTAIMAGSASYVSIVMTDGSAWDSPTAAIAGAFTLVAAATGTAIRVNNQYWAELERRMQDAVATRVADADRRVAEERLRIARDLHDSVGHEIAVVSMCLGAAEVHLPDSAHAARADLAAARTGIQSVLRETQQILAVLRVGRDEGPLTPTANYDQILPLIDSFRAAGLDVDATIAEVPDSLGATVSAAAYRIVQEALTNAHRYGTGTVTLTVVVGDDIRITTVNATAAEHGTSNQRTAREGYGLVGMRERAASAGGTLNVTSAGRLFMVEAVLRDEGGNAR